MPDNTPPEKTAPDKALADKTLPDTRLAVRKTYKLYIGGAFPRSESGRSYPVYDAARTVLANAAQASRKDARDAVVAARAATGKWAAATAYNRGQVLYRVAEMLEGRAGQFTGEVAAAEGVSAAEAGRLVDAAIDRWVWYAGWPDKVAQIAGAANPVSGPYFNFSVPEPTGVVAVICPQESSLLGLVSVLAPVIATGNAVVAVASEQRPLPAVTLSEVLATSDLPGGVVNLLTGVTAELAPVLAAHMDVNAIDITGADPAGRPELERLAADNVKRVFAAGPDTADPDSASPDTASTNSASTNSASTNSASTNSASTDSASTDSASTDSASQNGDGWAAAPDPRRMLAFLETKTVWHPMGM